MDYQIVEKSKFNVVVKTKIFSVKTNKQEIPQFWQEYFMNGSDKVIIPTIGICGEMINDTEFKYGIGMMIEEMDEIPNEFEVWNIPASTWAIFKCVGPMPDAIQNGWDSIFNEWAPTVDYNILPYYQIENYVDESNDIKAANYTSEIWIPVSKK